MIDVKQSLNDIELVKMELAKKDLRYFVEYAWHVVEPSKPFSPNWHIDAICEHLDAVLKGELKNLVINIPPRFMKSLNVSVLWPAWSWIENPSVQWLFSSYSSNLSIRDNVKTRRLLISPWFQDRWGDSFKFTGDQNAKQRYENDKSGYRIATSVDGTNTGEGGDIIVVDDPHNIKEIESDQVRISVIEWWDYVMSTRLNNPNTGSKVIVMQRSHQEDLSGHVLEQGGYEHLVLPNEFENEHRCVTFLGFEDPRKDEGELLWPDRCNQETTEELQEVLSEYAYAGQFQQRPAPKQGGTFKRDKWIIVDAIPGKVIGVTWRAWDKASTEDGGAFTVGTKMSRLEDGRFIITDVERGQWSSANREQHIKDTANKDGAHVHISIEQEPGSSGVDSVNASIRNLAGFVVEPDKVTGSKETRADPYATQQQNGNILLLRGSWNKAFIAEHTFFPNSKYKDQVDSASQVFTRVAGTLIQVFI